MKRSINELLRRTIFFIAGLGVMAFGVALSIKGNLGTSPISSLPYVLNQITGFSVGRMTICMHCFFILIQIAVLRKQYEIYQLLQLPVAILFGSLCDVAISCTSGIHCNNYLQQWIVCLIGIVLVALGVSMEFTADIVMLAGEGVVVAVCKVFPVKKGNMKICFDSTLVAIAVILSLLFLHQLSGVREGTLAAALLVGTIVKRFNRIMTVLDKKILTIPK